jgi:low affinity Fe/Cu permease
LSVPRTDFGWVCRSVFCRWSISHAQRRDTQAIQLKLDELIRVNSEARNELISLEAKPETVVEEVRSVFEELRERVEKDLSEPTAQ